MSARKNSPLMLCVFVAVITAVFFLAIVWGLPAFMEEHMAENGMISDVCIERVLDG